MHGRKCSAVVFTVLPIFCLFAAVSAGWAQAFTVSTATQALTIHPGDQNVPLTVSVSDSSYTGPISITLTGLPSGITVAPLALSPGTSGTLELSASVSADQEAFPANGPADANSASNAVMVVAAAGEMQASSPITLIVSLSNPAFAPAANDINLPIVRIDTNGTPVIYKTPSVPGTITITSADGQTSYLPNASDSDNTATFHVHGNTTAEMPKLAYNVKLNTSLDLLNAMGLTCPYQTSSGKPTCDKSKTYILLANYDDKTLLRDWSASALANAIPMGSGYLSSPAGSPSPSGTSTLMPWASHSLFVELYLNGVYEGNYQLIEAIKVDSHRVNIDELSETDTTGDVSGGYLLEIDEHEDEAYVFITPQGIPIGIDDPDFSPDPEVPAQTGYISNYVDTAENALFSSDFTDPKLGWRAYFDEASAVNFYIVNDVMGNMDGGDFYSSDYLYKDIDNPLLYMGPVWDFDISSGNVNYAPINNPTVPWMQIQSPWYKQWFTDPGFKADVVTQFNALKNNGVFTAWLNSIGQEAATLQQSQANNLGRWPMQGIRVWPNPEAAGSYSAELDYMITYINLRLAYLDSLFNAKTQTSTALTVSASTARVGSPVTLTAHVAGGTTPTGTVTFISQNTLVGPTATLDGSGNATVTVNNLPAGYYGQYAVYNGDNQNALSASNIDYINVLPPLVESSTSIASSAASVDQGDSVTFTASVTGTSGTATPTGTLTFTANGNTLGTAALLGTGSATFTTTNLSSGNDSVQAVYSGDDTYQASSSPAAAIAVAAGSFLLNADPSSATVKAGTAAAFNLTVTSQHGFSHGVSFSCSGLPAGLGCTFAPATVTPGSTPAATTLTISAVANGAAQNRAGSAANGQMPPPLGRWGKLGGGIAVVLLIWPVCRHRGWPMAALALMVVLSIAAGGCGSSSKSPDTGSSGGQPQQQTYSVTVAASGGGVSQSTVLTLTITD